MSNLRSAELLGELPVFSPEELPILRDCSSIVWSLVKAEQLRPDSVDDAVHDAIVMVLSEISGLVSLPRYRAILRKLPANLVRKQIRDSRNRFESLSETYDSAEFDSFELSPEYFHFLSMLRFKRHLRNVERCEQAECVRLGVIASEHMCCSEAIADFCEWF